MSGVNRDGHCESQDSEIVIVLFFIWGSSILQLRYEPFENPQETATTPQETNTLPLKTNNQPPTKTIQTSTKANKHTTTNCTLEANYREGAGQSAIMPAHFCA